MQLATYNIQYGTGKDGRVDLPRIAAELAGADVIALQEVDRFWRRSGGIDQAEQLAGHFPDFHWAFGPALDVLGAATTGANASGRRQYGNMVLARWPLAAVRNHALPKHALPGRMSLHRSALETVIDAPAGAFRLYSVHLGHADSGERSEQVQTLCAVLARAGAEGGAITGSRVRGHWLADGAAPAWPAGTVMLGDFNMLAGSPEYALMAAESGLVDAWTVAGQARPGITAPALRGGARLDYAFVSPEIAALVGDIHVDEAATGSDHQPLWLAIHQPAANKLGTDT